MKNSRNQSNIRRKQRSLLRLGWILLIACIVTLSSTAQAQELNAVGVALTGPNDRCGEQVWTLSGAAPGPDSRGTFLGIEDNSAGATDATALVAADCTPEADPNRLLATTFDSAYGAARGWVAPDDRLKNLTLRNIPVPGGNGVRAQIPLPGVVPPNPLPPTIARPTDPISLGRWLSATGSMTITCDDTEHTATVLASMSNLIPNGVYTVWGAWADTTGTVLEVPFGGLPNTIVADPNGNAEWSRDIDFCPLDFAPDGAQLQYISIAYHGDGVSYGTVPYEAFTARTFLGLGGLPFHSTIPGGIVTFNQLGFRVHGVGGPDPTAPDPDGDGIIGTDDLCPNTTPGDIINAFGCSIEDNCPCESDWRNHGAYVSCVARTSEDFAAAGLITEEEKDSIVSNGAQSECGSKK